LPIIIEFNYLDQDGLTKDMITMHLARNSTDEMIDIYDENLKMTGTISRAKAHKMGAWHRTIHIWIVRPINNGFVLFQKRGPKKALYPNCLDITAAGHYIHGEGVQDGTREISEELGINIDFHQFIPLGIKIDIAKKNKIINREFCDVFFLKRTESVYKYRLNHPELYGLFQISINDGLRLFSNNLVRVRAEGIEWSHKTNSWIKKTKCLKKSDFFPRIDPYYLKIFLLAKLLLKNGKHLSI
jgi:isopentenyldiphosphate isomerase